MEQKPNLNNVSENTVIGDNGADGAGNKVYHSEKNRHSHHHHNHSRSQKHKTNSNKKNKISAFFKRYKSILINILSCTVSVVLLIILATQVDKRNTVKESDEGYQPIVSQSTVKIETSLYADKVSIVSDAIEHYMNPINSLSAIETYRKFFGYVGGLNQGNPLTFIYRAIGLPLGVTWNRQNLMCRKVIHIRMHKRI